MPRAVMKAGYNPDDVTKIIFTHLHWDHTFYKDFKNAKYYAQRKEYEFAANPIPCTTSPAGTRTSASGSVYRRQVRAD